jgi:hypothetical protein
MGIVDGVDDQLERLSAGGAVGAVDPYRAGGRMVEIVEVELAAGRMT